MEFNVQKCAVLSITRKRKPSHHQYSIFGQPLANIDQHDHLGITIASDLRWNSHCNNVIKKSNKTLGLLRRTLALCSKDVKTKAYESFIRPWLEYASEAWCPHTSSLVDKIEQVQRAAARFMHSDYRWATHVTSLINNLGWDSLHVRRLLAQNVEQTFRSLVFLLIKYQFVRTEWKPAIKIGNAIIQPSPLARNLGVIMDSSLNMSSHVNNVCKSAMFGIRKIGQIRQYLTQDSTAKLVHAFFTSKLDSCNSLLFGLMDRDVMKVQRVQNTAARLVLSVSRREHITPALESLHWLPIQQRAVYKILLITFKALRGMAPAFISDLLSLYKPSRELRSSSDCQLRVIKSSTKFYGERSYAFAAAKLWNKLPPSIRHATNPGIFKAKLKTRFFPAAFLCKIMYFRLIFNIFFRWCNYNVHYIFHY